MKPKKGNSKKHRGDTICLDFNGVIHSFTSGWKGAAVIPDPPVKGAARAIEKLRMDYEIKIYSRRCGKPGGKEAIQRWLEKHHIIVDEVCENKPTALIYVDDRAVKFNGDWDECLQAINSFSHWMS